ncbi:MAG: DNA (cytosine-5-)-methyltransferase [Gammaproteobacteria bacterium]|nr:DNA (cytosine-5-)-methyltransferase [Gammaproteobacteria bacterium]
MTPAVNIEKLQNVLNLIGEDQLSSRLEVTPKTLKNWIKEQEVPKETLVSAKLDEIIDLIKNPKTASKSKFTFIDLFAGIGGIRQGFESIGGECVFTSEWDKYSQKTYLANYGDKHPVVGDITKVDTDLIPSHDVLLAGFPCQPFSLAGVSKKNSLGRAHGFECETQGTLFFDVERIIEAKQPKAFLLENVKNLKSHDKGRTFEVIKRTLEEKLGYQIFYKIIDADGFVPQHRERIFIVGFRKDCEFSWNEVSIPRKGSKTMDSVLHKEDGSEDRHGPYTIGIQGEVNEKYTLSTKLWQYLKDYKKKHEAKGNGFGYGMVTRDSVARTMSARYHKDGAEILVSRGARKNPRRLTPREAARLMGYKDSFIIPVSDTQSYRQFGNSVVVPVIEAIAKGMKPYILNAVKPNKKSSPQKELELAQ